MYSVVVDHMIFSSVGRRFHMIRNAATENATSQSMKSINQYDFIR